MERQEPERASCPPLDKKRQEQKIQPGKYRDISHFPGLPAAQLPKKTIRAQRKQVSQLLRHKLQRNWLERSHVPRHAT